MVKHFSLSNDVSSSFDWPIDISFVTSPKTTVSQREEITNFDQNRRNLTVNITKRSFPSFRLAENRRRNTFTVKVTVNNTLLLHLQHTPGFRSWNV